MRIGSICLFAAALLALSPAGLASSDPPAPGAAPPSARAIPGINAADPFPNGCVDCHINLVERKMDMRISTLMTKYAQGVSPSLLAKAQTATPEGVKLTGKHPATAAGKSVPSSCLGCHSRNAKNAPPFGKLLHVVHLTGAEQNHFMTEFKGECTLCHKFDSKTGAWRIPSAQEK